MPSVKGYKPPIASSSAAWIAPDDFDIGAILMVDANRHIVGLTPGANGKIIKSTGLSPSLPHYDDDLTGGGGGGGTIWDPHFDANTPNANADEFDGSSMAGYTAVNLGTTVFDVNVTKPSALVITAPDNAAGWRGWARALPAGDFTITTCVTVNALASNFTLGGLMLSTAASNASGNSLNTYVGWNTRPNHVVEVGTNWDSAGVSVRGNWQDIASHQRVILRCRRVGTTIWHGWSFDGRTFSELVGVTDATAYTWFGPSFYNNVTATKNQICWDYLRYQPSGTGIVYGAYV